MRALEELKGGQYGQNRAIEGEVAELKLRVRGKGCGRSQMTKAWKAQIKYWETSG